MPDWTANLTWWTLLDFYLIFIVSVFVLKFILHNKRILSMFMFYFVILGILWISTFLDLKLSSYIYQQAPIVFLVFIFVVGAPDFRLTLESLWKETVKSGIVNMGSERTKAEIIKAAMFLSKQNIGGLITIEKHNNLDQYAQRAITLNSEVSHELLINVFTPNTPMHDGAVIVRGDRVVCAGAYFVLSSNDNFEKTTGSRHRAALGISEITDSLTIVISEETGSISLAINGVMTKMKDENTLNEYLSLFMK
ncbi:DNA integrity scanning protein DisA [Acholeplasma oculi]|uniref:Diadenylate cyclase n=1 Tax=Acholeplasma oculi TaxID=35623 RepID=A0A061A9M4_9MOLU|nr:diadenylate cyclase [Acholeplasma oculi]CDR30099.1 putative DNA integrity scanning protein DisA [Acholeplasma oculi]SKC44840.1 diadenylate cyclase [Acholeplasma oculi]SUT88380.1 DNA integrity scanning protein DisA [Acholeplasma oculi]